MAKELLCFADDTTGGLDVAGSFYSRGYETAVCLEADCQEDADMTCQVYTHNSRDETPDESKKKLVVALGQIDRDFLSRVNLFLKVDSTLRGNILSDIDTVSEVVADTPIFLAPAFPFYGRMCVDGIYSVRGTPITDTEFATDPAFNYTSSFLTNNRKDIEHIDWRTLSQGPNVVAARVSSSDTNKFTFDTRDEADLAVIARAGLLMKAVMVGASGLARAIPRKQLPQGQPFVPDTNLPTLFVIGSIHEMSRMQKTQLAAIGVTGVDIPLDHVGNIRELQTINDHVKESLGNGSTLYLATPDSPTNDEGIWREMEDSVSEVTRISEVPHNLVIVGGETARATFRGRQITTLAIKSEYEPGIPISSERDRNEAIFTKAGGFGHSNTLVDIYQFLQK